MSLRDNESAAESQSSMIENGYDAGTYRVWNVLIQQLRDQPYSALNHRRCIELKDIISNYYMSNPHLPIVGTTELATHRDALRDFGDERTVPTATNHQIGSLCAYLSHILKVMNKMDEEDGSTQERKNDLSTKIEDLRQSFRFYGAITVQLVTQLNIYLVEFGGSTMKD